MQELQKALDHFKEILIIGTEPGLWMISTNPYFVSDHCLNYQIKHYFCAFHI